MDVCRCEQSCDVSVGQQAISYLSDRRVAGFGSSLQGTSLDKRE